MEAIMIEILSWSTGCAKTLFRMEKKKELPLVELIALHSFCSSEEHSSQARYSTTGRLVKSHSSHWNTNRSTQCVKTSWQRGFQCLHWKKARLSLNEVSHLKTDRVRSIQTENNIPTVWASAAAHCSSRTAHSVYLCSGNSTSFELDFFFFFLNLSFPSPRLLLTVFFSTQYCSWNTSQFICQSAYNAHSSFLHWLSAHKAYGVCLFIYY